MEIGSLYKLKIDALSGSHINKINHFVLEKNEVVLVLGVKKEISEQTYILLHKTIIFGRFITKHHANMWFEKLV